MNQMLPDAVANATELRKTKKGPKLQLNEEEPLPTVIEENNQEENKGEKAEARESNVLAESQTSLQVPKE